jgi:hypothetical protein
MGRSMSWFIIPQNIKHDNTNQLCFDLEFEPEKDNYMDLKIKLFNTLNPDIKIDVDTDFAGYCNRKEEIINLWNSYIWDKKNMWCPKCRKYINGAGFGEIDSFSLSHSYSSSYWFSDWNIRDFFMGSDRTNFVRRFDKQQLFREICDNDIQIAYRTIEELGEPIRTSDKEAKSETLDVLEFLKKYSNDNVHIILQDEY